MTNAEDIRRGFLHAGRDAAFASLACLIAAGVIYLYVKATTQHA